ncbi:MAG: decarboxylating 6-phosphogluconate dehydrogenase [Candidatus Acidoferrales bacterium]
MHVGMIGLGRMGAAMSERLRKQKHKVVVYDRNAARVKAAVKKGARGAGSLSQVIQQLPSPHVVWIMVPAGGPTAAVLRGLESHLQAGDIIIDGGNSYYRDSVERARTFKQAGIYFLDAGVSGGVWGLREGYCLMVGGEKAALQKAEPLFRALAPKDGYAHVGPSGAGHFAKMVHNGIEYGMLQAYGEGFELLAAAEEFKLDLHQLAALWNHGSVIRSWLLELAASALRKDRRLRKIRGYVEDSGEGRWTIEDAVARAVPVTAIAHSLFARFATRQKDSFSAKLIAALRQEFGGHAVKKG